MEYNQVIANQQKSQINLSFKIEKWLNELQAQGENAQLTTQHRYIYESRNLNILVEMHKKLNNKLAHLNVLDPAYAFPEYNIEAGELLMDSLYNR